MAEGGRTNITAEDYFLQQKKKLDLADRRPPSSRKISNRIGPAISKVTVRTEDYNALSTAYNGFYSSVRAKNGPDVEVSGPDQGFDINPYVGQTIMDAELGGWQEVTNLSTGVTYRRLGLRTPSLPELISWSVWSVV